MRRRVRAFVVLWCILCPFTAAAGTMTVTFFDVGQGDAALIETPGGKRLLIDGGAEPSVLPTGEVVGSRDVLPLLRACAIDHLDAVIVSHAHPDHVQGVRAVIGAIRVARGYFPALPAGDAESRSVAADMQGRIPLTFVREGTRIEIDPAVSVEVIGPPSTFFFDDTNDNSLLIRVSYGHVRFLFPGDCGAEALDWYAERAGERLRATVLKVPHHGSYNAVNGAFVRAVGPAAVVVSCGQNPYGHPHEKTLQFYRRRAAKVYRTDQQGSIRVTTDGTRYTVIAERP